MAIKATVETQFGEERELYIRLNSMTASNHGSPTVALFRGYLSKDAFADGRAFVWEQEIELDADVSKPLWDQAYSKLKSKHADAKDA